MPLSTIPEASDFLEALHPIIYLPPNNKPTNVIVFLPGLGDTSSNFSTFARALNLPDAVTITLQPLYPLAFPVGPGFHWSDDLQVDTSSGAIDEDSPLSKGSSIVAEVITDVLIQKHNFAPSSIQLFGFGQGGSLAMSVALQESLLGRSSLGGVISIGGPLPLSVNHAANTKTRTPVLVLGGVRGRLAASDGSPVKRIKALFEFVQYHEWKKADDAMPKNRDEVLPMMEFFARRLKSRRGVPDSFVEI